MRDTAQLFLELGIGFAIVFISLGVLQLVCNCVASIAKALEKVLPSLVEPAALPTPVRRKDLGRAGEQHDVVSASTPLNLPRETILAVIQAAVDETFPGQRVRILSYGLPRVVEGGGNWAHAMRQRHFESHKIR